MISIRTIEHAKGKTFIKYAQESRVPDDDCVTVTSYEQPRPEFEQAMEALTACIISELELPEDWAEQVAVDKVSVEYKRDHKAYVLHGVRTLPESGLKLELKMPCKPEPKSNSARLRPEIAVKEDTLAAINTLEEEAARFLAGDRAQGQLFTDGEGEAA